MKAVTRYTSLDGSEWKTKKEAIERDVLYVAVSEAMVSIGPRPELDSSQHEVHGVEAFRAAKSAVLDLARARWPDLPVWKHPNDVIHQHGGIGRVLTDSDGPIARAWSRLMCFDDEGREWEQPYFARHPEEAKRFAPQEPART